MSLRAALGRAKDRCSRKPLADLLHLRIFRRFLAAVRDDIERHCAAAGVHRRDSGYDQDGPPPRPLGARGERLVANVPHGHWKALTLVAALRIDGLTAPYVIDGAMDGPSFLAYVEQVLVPTLQKGDTVFMDNLRTHKIDGIAQAIKAVGAKPRYLPAYSPDLNPIEQAFSKLKAALRKGPARTVTALLKLIGRLVKTFAPDECANYFRHAGYGR
jgi:transposase